MMLTYIITIQGLEASERQAQQCLISAEKFDIHAQLFPATNKFEASKMFEQYDLLKKLPKGIRERHHPFKHEWLGMGEAGCFMSHYRLWHLCIVQNQPILILEDDATVVSKFPKSLQVNEFLSVGAFTELWNKPERFTHLFDKRVKFDHNYQGIQEYPLRGALGIHGYIITPVGAKKMIAAVNTTKRLWPVDIMISKKYVDMKILCPHPVIATTDISPLRDSSLWNNFNG